MAISPTTIQPDFVKRDALDGYFSRLVEQPEDTLKSTKTLEMIFEAAYMIKPSLAASGGSSPYAPGESKFCAKLSRNRTRFQNSDSWFLSLKTSSAAIKDFKDRITVILTRHVTELIKITNIAFISIMFETEPKTFSFKFSPVTFIFSNTNVFKLLNHDYEAIEVTTDPKNLGLICSDGIPYSLNHHLNESSELQKAKLLNYYLKQVMMRFPQIEYAKLEGLIQNYLQDDPLKIEGACQGYSTMFIYFMFKNMLLFRTVDISTIIKVFKEDTTFELAALAHAAYRSQIPYSQLEIVDSTIRLPDDFNPWKTLEPGKCFFHPYEYFDFLQSVDSGIKINLYLDPKSQERNTAISDLELNIIKKNHALFIDPENEALKKELSLCLDQLIELEAQLKQDKLNTGQFSELIMNFKHLVHPTGYEVGMNNSKITDAGHSIALFCDPESESYYLFDSNSGLCKFSHVEELDACVRLYAIKHEYDSFCLHSFHR